MYGQREERLGPAGRISERAIYAVVGGLTVASFLFFAFVLLPSAYREGWVWARPQEWVAALFFLLALMGYLRKGEWQRVAFEHWLVLSMIVAFLGQAVFMSTFRPSLRHDVRRGASAEEGQLRVGAGRVGHQHV